MQAPGKLIHVRAETRCSNSTRARQLSSMFDAPPEEKSKLEFKVHIDLDSAPWNVGLVVGPSGSGKTTIMRELWGEPEVLKWGGAGVVDDFEKSLSVETISAACQAVGFNTIPAWMRPYEVLSNGEKFRVELARRLLRGGDPIVVDEFTSVVDRQVAKIGSHAVQKWTRKNSAKFVAVTCHYDVVDWLQPDWVIDMATKQFTRRLLQRRPTIECVVGRLPRSSWALFAPFHYMTAEIHVASKCFGIWANGQLAAFASTLHRPVSHEISDSIWGCNRLVTLPDFQGMGLAMVLIAALGADYKAGGMRLRTYPAHPALVRSFDHSPDWQMMKAPGFTNRTNRPKGAAMTGNFGGRPCAVFEYAGAAAEECILH